MQKSSIMKLKIWSKKEINLYDRPPIFNSIQRKKFLTLPVKLEKKVQTFYSIHIKVGFYLMYGYFKARRRFFSVDQFRSSDVQFVCKRLGYSSEDVNLTKYNRQTYRRQRNMKK